MSAVVGSHLWAFAMGEKRLGYSILNRMGYFDGQSRSRQPSDCFLQGFLNEEAMIRKYSQ